MSSTPELVYFDGRGRGEIIRLTLAAANIKFNEVYIETREAFEALMPDLLFQQVPLLKIDGLNLVQTSAIVRYIGQKAGLLGGSETEKARVDMLYEGTRDMYRGFFAFGFHPDESAVKEAIEKDLIKYLPVFNQVLLDHGDTGYLVGSKLTIADIGLFEVIQSTVEVFTADRLKDFPGIVKFYSTLSSLDNIQHYVKEVRKRANDEKYCTTVAKVLNRKIL